MGSRSTFLSFVLGIALAMSLALLAPHVRSRLFCGAGGCDERVAMPATLASPEVRPTDAASPRVESQAAEHEPAASVYVMRAEDPAERALADARRAAAAPAPVASDNPRSDVVVMHDRRPEIDITESSRAIDDREAALVTVASPTPHARAHEMERRARRPAGIPDLAGWWAVTNSIESTEYPAYEGIRLVYRLRLRHEGDRIVGQGEKWLENGRPVPPWQRTPIFVSGTIHDGRVEMRFVEHGRRRTSEGRFTWTLSPDAARLDGRFASTVANTSGRSEAQRM